MYVVEQEIRFFDYDYVLGIITINISNLNFSPCSPFAFKDLLDNLQPQRSTNIILPTGAAKYL